METQLAEITLITGITDKLIDFMTSDDEIKEDYEDFTLTIAARQLSKEEIRSRTITYLFTRQLQNRSVFEIFLERCRDTLTDAEKDVVKALSSVITGVFKINKVFKNGAIEHRFLY